MSIFNLFGSSHVDESPIYTDTDSEGDSSDDAYMYRIEPDDTYTPLSKEEFDAETEGERKGWFGLW